MSLFSKQQHFNILDPNRPTWEQYKKDNEEKLDMVGPELRKMVEYRTQLDVERDKKLSQGGAGKRTVAISDSDEDEDEAPSEEDKKRKRKEKKHKKEKKRKVCC